MLNSRHPNTHTVTWGELYTISTDLTVEHVIRHRASTTHIHPRIHGINGYRGTSMGGKVLWAMEVTGTENGSAVDWGTGCGTEYLKTDEIVNRDAGIGNKVSALRTVPPH